MARSLRPFEIYPITTRCLEVLRVADVTPGMRRVTLGGEGLAAHTAPSGMPVEAFRSDTFDDEFKLLLTHPDLTEPLVPQQGDGRLVWPRDPKLVMRTYTVRRWDPAAGEVDVDFVCHGVGAATTWAMRARPGDRVHIAGPKSSAGHPLGVDWTLIAGDETALPAIARWLEEWPDGARAQVFIEIGEDSHRQDLVVPGGVELTWLSRDGAEPGTTTLMFDALRAAPWWPGDVFAWVAGEARTLVPIRRWLRNDKELPREAVEVTGYWRRSEVVTSEADPTVPVADEDEKLFAQLREKVDVVPGFAARVAITVGLPAALESGPAGTAELVDATGCDGGGLAALLGYLAAVGLVERRGGADAQEEQWALTPLGADLNDEHLCASLDLGAMPAQQEIAGLLSLLAAVRTGRGDSERWFGAPWDEHVASSTELSRARVLDGEMLADYYAATLAEALPLTDAARALVLGPAAGVVAEALVAAHRRLDVTVVACPAEIEAMTDLHPAHERVRHEVGGPLHLPDGRVDAVVLDALLAREPDANARHILAGAAERADDVLVFVEVVNDDEEFGVEELGAQLVGYALGRPRERTDRDWRDLFASAGLDLADRVSVGWGGVLYRLRRA